MYLKKEKKHVSNWNFPLKRRWYYVIQRFLSSVQAKYYFPRQISDQGISLRRGHDTFSREILKSASSWDPVQNLARKQARTNSSLFSLLPRLHPSFHFLSLFRSWSPVCILELGRYATYNRQTSVFERG